MSLYYTEKFRPQFHFTPEKNWMNDPNGLVYYQGEYHLFYQYHPFDNVWGPMHWGHAVSKDLVHWEHFPIALEPDEKGNIFSGSTVVDWHDTSGFFNGGHGLVAIFTHADTYPGTDRPRQRQSLAYSLDKGRTWHKYEGNPVLIAEGLTDFRDPKVFWHQETEKWVMVLAAGDHVRFYGSRNLKDWKYLSSFTGGTTEGVWECPDIFPLPVENSKQVKWLLEVDVNPGGPQGGSGAQYFVGDFDGTQFVNSNPAETVFWFDYGKDFYAGVSWSDIPPEDGRRLWLAWMSNWQYAEKVPTEKWRNAMTFPRELTLKQSKEGYRVCQRPVQELKYIRDKTFVQNNLEVIANKAILTGIIGATLEIKAEFELDSAREFGFALRKSAKEETLVGYDVKKEEIFIDRTYSGIVDFHPGFPGRHGAFLSAENGKIKMHILLDWSSVELFANGGLVSLTALIFPQEDSHNLELYTRGGKVKLNYLEINKLNSIWRKEKG